MSKVVVVEDHGHAYKLHEDGYLLCTPLLSDDTYDDDMWTMVEEMPWDTHDALCDIAENLGSEDGDYALRMVTFY